MDDGFTVLENALNELNSEELKLIIYSLIANFGDTSTDIGNDRLNAFLNDLRDSS